MIIFLYGEDSFRAKEKLQEIVDHYKEVHKSGLNLAYIDAKEKSIRDLFDNFKIAGMFDEKKLIVLKDLFSNIKFQEDFLKEIKTLEDSKNIVVVFEKESVDKRSKLLKVLTKTAKCQEFKFLDQNGLHGWFEAESEKYGAKFDPQAKAVLFSYIGNDLWRMGNEIKKLANFKKNKVITKQDVESNVKPKIETDIFKTIEEISQKNKKQALNLLQKHIEDGENPLYLFSMITYQFRNLLIIKELIEQKKPYEVVVKKSGLHPFVVKKTYYISNQFTLSELKKIYQKIFQIDLDIKTGKIDAETALDLFVASI